MSDWNLETGTVNKTQWLRSWRQEFYTDLGSDFKLKAHLETVVMLDDGNILHKQAGEVTRVASIVGSDPRVQQIQILLTELIQEWIAEDEAKKEAGSNDIL